MARKKKYVGHQNPEAFRAEVERASSGAAGTHKDKRDKRARTRAARLRRAVKDAD